MAGRRLPNGVLIELKELFDAGWSSPRIQRERGIGSESSNQKCALQNVFASMRMPIVRRKEEGGALEILLKSTFYYLRYK